MGNKSCELINNGKTVLFAFEEAIGKNELSSSNTRVKIVRLLFILLN